MAGQPISLAEKILLTRHRLGEEQKDFGKRFDVKRWMVNQWERGKALPKSEHLAKLQELFRSILGDEEETQVKRVTYQLLLPFELDFRMSPHGADKMNFTLQVKRKAS